MNYPLLFALGVGATLALTAPTMAQTVTKPAEKEQQRRQQVERHIETLDDDDEQTVETTIEWDADSLTEAIERQVESLREAIQQRADSIAETAERYADSLREVIEQRADSLQSIADSLQEVADAEQARADDRQAIGDSRQALEAHSADMDSLRALIRRQMASSREAMGNVRELNKQMRNQMRQMRKIHILTRNDTTGMAKELQAAELALESVRRSIQPLDSSMILFGKDAEGALRMEFGDSTDGTPKRFLVMVEKDDHGDHPRRFYFNGGNSFVVQAYGDSVLTYRRFINDAKAYGGSIPPIPPMPPVPPVPMTSMSIFPSGRVVVFGNDSINVVDGSDVQTVIQISGDSSSKHTIVVISSRSEGEGGHAMAQITMTRTTISNCASGKVAKPTTPPAPLHEDAAGHTLAPNYPNPFLGSTTISFTLPRAEHATLTVYDAHGTLIRTLKDEEMAAGNHSVVFDASGLPSGTYLYRLAAGGFNETKTMTLEK